MVAFMVMTADDPTVLGAEVGGGAISLTGLLLVFLPFFLDRLRAAKDGASVSTLRWLRRLMWLTAAAVMLPAAAATSGLVTLWGIQDLAVLTAVLVTVALWTVAAFALLTVWLERRVWA